MTEPHKQRFNAIVKPNSKTSQIKGFNKERNAYMVDIKAKPENNKANIELIKLLSKRFKKKVRIVSGSSYKKKIIEIID